MFDDMNFPIVALSKFNGNMMMRKKKIMYPIITDDNWRHDGDGNGPVQQKQRIIIQMNAHEYKILIQ